MHQRRALWDRRDFDHFNARVLNQMWAEVAEEANCTIDAVRNKWRSHRGGYTRRRKKIPVSTTGNTEVEFYNYTTWHYFKHLFFLKDQYLPQVSSEDIPPNEKKNLGDDLTDALDGSESLQQTFNRLCDQKEQTTSHASTVDIPLNEKETLREDQRDKGRGKLQSSQHSSKGLCHENGQISFHVSIRDLAPKGGKTLRDDQTNLRDEKLQSSQHTFKGRRHERDQISSQTSSKGISPKEKKDFTD